MVMDIDMGQYRPLNISVTAVFLRNIQSKSIGRSKNKENVIFLKRNERNTMHTHKEWLCFYCWLCSASIEMSEFTNICRLLLEIYIHTLTFCDKISKKKLIFSRQSVCEQIFIYI